MASPPVRSHAWRWWTVLVLVIAISATVWTFWFSPWAVAARGREVRVDVVHQD